MNTEVRKSQSKKVRLFYYYDMTNMTTTVSSKGQIVLPKKVRDAKDIRPGDDLEVVDQDDGILLRKISRKADWLDVLRSIPWKGLEIPKRSRQRPRKPPKL